VQRSSIRFKGWVLDNWAAAEFGARTFRRVIGYHADELGRAEKDTAIQRQLNTEAGRTICEPHYPLILARMDRAAVEAYVLASLGEPIKKSYCAMCLMWNRVISAARSGGFTSTVACSCQQEQQPRQRGYGEDRHNRRQTAALEEEDERLWSVHYRDRAEQCQGTDSDDSGQPLCEISCSRSGYRMVPTVHLRLSSRSMSQILSVASGRGYGCLPCRSWPRSRGANSPLSQSIN
jgi:hypothetical protein